MMIWAISKNSRVFNFTIFLNSRKFHAREIYMVYSIVIFRYNSTELGRKVCMVFFNSCVMQKSVCTAEISTKITGATFLMFTLYVSSYL